MKVFFSPLAEYKLTKLLFYLEDEWGKSSKEKFLKELEAKVNQISSQPKSTPLAEDFDKVHWCVVTPQSSFYYRVLKQEIEVITITDNRQNPDKTIKEIRSHFAV
ncbi:MAG: type II toxin-antitoxin system RelE/ParE family toxin [Balneolaceae bacterium]|nr:type II toxin-antitoxin system RelE/ParE family toxin [Balneolaceae bacterium]